MSKSQEKFSIAMKGELKWRMDIKQMTLAEFMCEDANNIIADAGDAFFIMEGLASSMIAEDVHCLGAGYKLHTMLPQSGTGNIVLTHQGECVGFYLGEALAIHPDHRRKGLSTPIILEAIKHRPDPKQRNSLSNLGKKALERAWRVAHNKEENVWC